ncbi:response regulator [Xylophilus sp.]|uniref:response regulator n=1 Tax=Xylophilus sp. TaxID=2653893 RepID=UPI0013BD2FEF|nr:response regulator [Xylophilus sp.]KAF1049472.1 MAG: Sensory/regulatory protein RpfC [Xylophilus sp.]
MDQSSFRRILTRNVALPLGLGVLGAVLFVALVAYLLSVMRWVEHTDLVMARANAAARESIELETGMRGFLITGDDSFLQPYEDARAHIERNLLALQQLVSDNRAQVDRVQRIIDLQRQWKERAENLIAQRRTGADFTSVVGSGCSKRLVDDIRREFGEFLQVEENLRFERGNTATNATVAVVAVYVVVSLLFSGVIALFGRRELVNLSATYGSLLDEQARHAEATAHQAWLRTGQNRLSEAQVGSQSLADLGRRVLEEFGSYLRSKVGALYVRDDHGGLRRIATYGLARTAQNADEALGQDDQARGLVAQAVLARRVMRLDSVPEGFLKVVTGLGDGTPQGVLLAPVFHEGQVTGVIELGFLRPLQDRDVELLEAASGSLGASIEAARYRARLQDALAETQQLNEELQVQQEELRTANEELEEQSRALKESQAQLEGQQAELEQTNEQLSEQAQLLDQRNAALNIAQEELEQHAEELQRASRYKSEFLANMSHELRTPLNSTLILARLLADNPRGNLDAEQIRFAESIHAAGRDLLALINDILDISKVEAGKLEVHPQEIPLARLGESLRMLFEPQTRQKGLEFAIEIAANAPATVYTDVQRIEQILKNLLSNAIKFTDAGRVALQIAPAAGGRIAFTVQDSGIGIRSDQHETIFEAFRQADGSTSRRYGGTGLGLSISRNLARLLGGDIHVQSQPGQGSRFTLDLPREYDEATAQAAPTPLPAPVAHAPRVPPPGAGAPAPSAAPHVADDRAAPRDAAGRCVLVIEDEPQFAGILYDLAHERGYRCLVAHGIEEGFGLATEYVPDAILLDMRLPDGSGLTVLQQLKDEPRTRHIPVHIVSVDDQSEAALHLGAVGYAIKPATREQLKQVFEKVEARLDQTVKRVLVVEDDDLQRESVVALIRDDDVDITAVATGAEALELLGRNVYDCMIIDLKLPDMSGSELLARMSVGEICSFPPVIVHTGRNLTRDEEAALLRYSRSIIIKGARSPERLLDEVTLFLHKVESGLSSERRSMLRAARSRDKVFEGRKILLVDDDVRNLFALTSTLEQKGAVIEVARNGQEAIDQLDRHADTDIVLMDVMMPGMDGLEATRRIRTDARWKKLPIIAVTAKAMKDDREQCMRAGANDYLAKPIDLDRLFSLLRVWMPKMERL